MSVHTTALAAARRAREHPTPRNIIAAEVWAEMARRATLDEQIEAIAKAARPVLWVAR